MTDFGDLDNFNEHEVQGRPIKAYKNGYFENPKSLFVQLHWSWDDFLCSCSQRLEMVPMASRVFNSDGVEIDDLMCIEEGDMLFFSTGAPFKIPGQDENTEDVGTGGVVGGYRVTTLLGRGGFGEVRLGVHQLTNEKVALKFILKNEMGSLGDVERTTTEIQCLTALNHPSIIKLIRVFNEPNHVALVFELLEGGDLYHHLIHLDISGGITEEKGALVFSQILSGVGYAHNQHICHRDLKLENILLQNKNDLNSVKIADFGLSDFYRPGSMSKTTCGSISYLPPEVFRGTSNAGPPLDVWSLGVILFAIVYGRLPFEGSDLKGSNRPRENVIRNRIMRAQYKIDEHLSPEVTDLIQKMLQLDPIERATIPEIFSHPWIRGKAGSVGLDSLTMMASSPCKDGEEDLLDECESFTFKKDPPLEEDKTKGSLRGNGIPLVPPLSNIHTVQSPPSTVVTHPSNSSKRNIRHKSPRTPSTPNGGTIPTISGLKNGSERHGLEKHVDTKLHLVRSPTNGKRASKGSNESPVTTPKDGKDKGRRAIHPLDERLVSMKSKRRADGNDQKLTEALDPIN